LSYAAQGGHTEIAKALIAAGANVNLINNRGMSPLNCAQKSNNYNTVKLLMSAGARY
jgi:ankyrin repeat protein